MKSPDKIFTDQIKSIVQQTDPTAVTILYGSRATGKAREDSDWDILILLDRPTVSIKDEQVFRGNLYDLELESGEPISTFVYAKDDWNTRLSATPLYQSVKQYGIIL
jgi:predicted nucleotidyltransferase